MNNSDAITDAKEEPMSQIQVQLYDISKHDYPNQRSDSFRSLQVFECWVCRALTNAVVMGGSAGYGKRSVCPNSSECWHHEIEAKIEWAEKPHPATYQAELEQEISAMRSASTDKIKNDLLGNPDLSQKRSVTNTKSTLPGGTSCKHCMDW